MEHPLDGVKVVDLAAYIAGAYCSSLLADMGARVTKVESHAGDGFRQMTGSFQGWNRGKRGVIVNLTTEVGRDILYRMVADADVVVENYRPGVAQRLGADYDTLREINGNIVYCTLAGYGTDGPHSKEPGFDALLQALSGAMVAQGGKGNPPVFLRVAISDYAAAILAAYGIAAALFHRAKTGQGQRLETSLLNTSIAVQAAEFLSYAGKPAPPPVERVGPSATYRLYEAEDGWFFLSCGDDESWARVCEVLERPDLSRKFSDRDARARHDAEIATVLEASFATAGRDSWLSRLQAAGVKCAASRHIVDVHDDPQAIHTGLTVDAVSPDFGPVSQMGLPIKFYGTPGVIWGPTPSLGQHTDEVLAELGYSSKEMAELREGQVVG